MRIRISHSIYSDPDPFRLKAFFPAINFFYFGSCVWSQTKTWVRYPYLFFLTYLFSMGYRYDAYSVHRTMAFFFSSAAGGQRIKKRSWCIWYSPGVWGQISLSYVAQVFWIRDVLIRILHPCYRITDLDTAFFSCFLDGNKKKFYEFFAFCLLLTVDTLMSVFKHNKF